MVIKARAARQTAAFIGDIPTAMSAQAAAAFAAMQTQIIGIESEVSSLGSSISTINTKLDAIGKTPWPTYIAGAGFLLAVMTTLGVIAYKPIDSQLTLLTAEFRDQTHSIVPRTEHEREWNAVEKRLEQLAIGQSQRELKEVAILRAENFQRQLDNDSEWLKAIQRGLTANGTLAVSRADKPLARSPSLVPER